MERWLSGLKRRPAKALIAFAVRRFKSSPLRQRLTQDGRKEAEKSLLICKSEKQNLSIPGCTC